MSVYENINFHITWDEGDIIYSPYPGLINSISSNKVIKIERPLQSILPWFCTPDSEQSSIRFKPFCLTIYLGHLCNLACNYCYASNNARAKIKINSNAIKAAAEYIATNCIELNKPFILGFHGGTEPLLKPEMIERCIEICRSTALKFNLEFLPFCTTNGVISENVARWAAQTFYGIGLSWDGPARIHDHYRRTRNGGETSSIVQNTAEVFLNSPQTVKHFRVRTTITQKSVNRLHDILAYFHASGIRNIEFCPVFYHAGEAAQKEFRFPAMKFVFQYLNARRWAAKKNLFLTYPGTRINEFHDKHCPVYQDNLTITSDGYFTSCFIATHNTDKSNEQFMYGWYDDTSSTIKLDVDKLTAIVQRLTKPYKQCTSCFNYLHCAKECPVMCPLHDNSSEKQPFDCTTEKYIGLAAIIELADFDLPLNDIRDTNDFFSHVTVKAE